MASIIPTTVHFLQATAIVRPIELASLGSVRILHEEAKRMVDTAVQKMLQDCVKVDKRGEDHVLHLDVYIMSPSEMQQIILNARKEGMMDAARWDGQYVANAEKSLWQ